MCLKDEKTTSKAEGEEEISTSNTEDAIEVLEDTKSTPMENFFIKIRDMSSAATDRSVKPYMIPITSTISSFLKEISDNFAYELKSFALTYQRSCGQEVEITDLPPDTPLTKIGLSCKASGNSMVLLDRRGQVPRSTKQLESDFDAVALSTSAENQTDSRTYRNQSSFNGDASNQSEAINTSILSSESVSYVGLVNQAMTCYLNSLLQTLFMTPEFRNAIYRWDFKGSNEESYKSIPFQLQKLFLQLQTTSRFAVETTSLTRSFGWNSSEVWQQHDIQELYRIMLDALEQHFKKTPQAELINNLYEGTMKDYVKCLKCGTENAREDKFLDIPLPIRPFGSNSVFKSVEEALQAFVDPELLSDNNKYECSKCATLCDAHKGLKFTRFPYLLTLHLKRFDFDYQTFHRIKLNDKVVFPMILDLNSFIDESPNTTKSEPDSSGEPLSSSSRDALNDASPSDSGSAFDAEENSSAGFSASTHTLNDDSQEEDEGIDVSINAGNESCRERFPSSGPFVYELFSIMIHSGSASGGHYYAYIKDFDSGEWFCFNDQIVSKITDEDIRRAYGRSFDFDGESSWTPGSSSSSANAYMLMYRMIDKQQNAVAIAKEDFPTHIKDLLVQMTNEEVAERRAKEVVHNRFKISLFCSQKKGTYSLCIPKDWPLNEVTKAAYELLDLQDIAPIERCRLVKYDQLYDYIECSFKGKDDQPICELLEGGHFSSKYDLLMEILEAGQEEFEEYRSGDISVKVFEVNLEEQEVSSPKTVRLDPCITVRHFKEMLSKSIPCSLDSMQVVQECNSKECVKYRPLTEDHLILKDLDIHSSKLFVEATGTELDVLFYKSRMYSFLRIYSAFTLTVFLPNRSPEVLKELGIPEFKPEEIKSPDSQALNNNPRTDTEPTIVNGTSLLDDKVSNEVDATENGITTSNSQVNSKLMTPVDFSNPSNKISDKNATEILKQRGVSECRQQLNDTSSETSLLNSNTEKTVVNGMLQHDHQIGTLVNGDECNQTDGYSSLSNSKLNQHKQMCSSPSTGPLSPTLEVSVQTSPSHSTASTSTSVSISPKNPSTTLSNSLPSAQLPTTVSVTKNCILASSLSTNKVKSNPSDGPALAKSAAKSNVHSKNSGDCSSQMVSSITNHPLVPPNSLPDLVSVKDRRNSIGEFDESVNEGFTSGVSSDHSTSENSSLTSDSERTLVGDPPDDNLSNHSPDYCNVSSPEDNQDDMEKGDDEDGVLWDEPIHTSFNSSWDGKSSQSAANRFFHASYIDNDVLKISVDNQMTGEELKAELQSYVGVHQDHFKFHFIHSQLTCEIEAVRLNKPLASFSGEYSGIKIMLERFLLPGEYKGQVCMLETSNPDGPSRFLLDFVIREKDPVWKVKEAIIDEINARGVSGAPFELPLDASQYRLRKKTWKSPQTVYMDHQLFEDDIILYPNWVLYLQNIAEGEEKTDPDQVCLFVRRWHSTHSSESLVDITLTEATNECFAKKLSSLSSIPVERLEAARGRGTFPCDIALQSYAELLWYNVPLTGNLDQKPFHVSDDGNVFYYRDSADKCKESPSREEQGSSLNSTNTTRSSSSSSPFHRPTEKALKIYLDRSSDS